MFIILLKGHFTNANLRQRTKMMNITARMASGYGWNMMKGEFYLIYDGRIQ